MRRSFLFLAMLAGLATAPALAAPRTLDPSAYGAFVGNWTPADRPLCAMLRSAEEWGRVMHPAPVMGGNKPMAPDATLFDRHAVLLYARVTDHGDMRRILAVKSATTHKDVLTVKLRYVAPPPSSFRIKSWLGLVVEKPEVRHVRFVENGVETCSLDLARGDFRSPPDGP